MRLGFIISNYPGERRIPLLPEHVQDFANEVVIETGLGQTMGISDEAYEAVGCEVMTREEIFAECPAIVSLKLLQPSDYDMLREGQMIIGWTHPEESGKEFYREQAIPKKLFIVDLDNVYPRIYYQNRYVDIPWIPEHFVHRNSYIAGFAGTMHALVNYGLAPDSSYKTAVLGSGNVSQGAMNAISKFSSNVRMFYRRTMPDFHRNMSEFDIIINGIQIKRGTEPILSLEDQKKLKKGALLVCAAADGDGAIEGIEYTTWEKPVYEKDGLYYYCLANTPSVFYRNASQEISKAFSQWVYSVDLRKFYDLANELREEEIASSI